MKYEVPNDDFSKLDAMQKDIDAKLAAVAQGWWGGNNMILERKYVAIIEGCPQQEQGQIKIFLFHSRLFQSIKS